MFSTNYDFENNYYLINDFVIIDLFHIFINFYKIILYDFKSIFFNIKNNNFYNNNNLNIYNTILPITINEIFFFNKKSNSNTLIFIFSQFTNFYEILNYLQTSNIIIYNNFYNENIYYKNYYLFTIIFLVIFIYVFFNNVYFENIKILELNKNNFIVQYEEFLNLWIRFTGTKFESYEEALSTIILWPWCIFLIFSHTFSQENNEIFFIFIEWGLPIIYGYLIIFESITLFGNYFFIYLNGSRGRTSFIITIIEDLISFIILLSRISLQIVRGLICGLYHDFFREITEYLNDTWENYLFSIAWFKINTTTNFYITDIFFFFVDLYILSFILFFIYILLFLQILFLLIAVWLFCRCWFISLKITTQKFKFYLKNNKRELNLWNKNKNKILQW